MQENYWKLKQNYCKFCGIVRFYLNGFICCIKKKKAVYIRLKVNLTAVVAIKVTFEISCFFLTYIASILLAS